MVCYALVLSSGKHSVIKRNVRIFGNSLARISFSGCKSMRDSREKKIENERFLVLFLLIYLSVHLDIEIKTELKLFEIVYFSKMANCSAKISRSGLPNS